MSILHALTVPASHASASARARVRFGLFAGACVVVGMSTLMFDVRLTFGLTPLLIVLTAGVLLGLSTRIRALWDAWDRYGGVVVIAATAATVAVTGGIHSPFHGLYLLNGVFGGLFYVRRRLVAESAVTIAVLLAPLVYDSPRAVAAELPDMLFHAMMFAAIVTVVHIQTTTRIGQQQRLRDSEVQTRRINRRLQMVVDAVPLPFVELDTDDRVRRWNPAAERTFGWSADEVIGRSLPVVPPQHVDQHDELWALVKAGHTITDLEVQRQHRDGRRLDVSAFAAPLCDETDTLQGALVFYVDLTERNRLEKQLRQAQKMQALGHLAGGVAHDFNNLLTVILGTIDLTLQDAQVNETVRGDLEEVRSAGQQGARIVNDLLELGQRRSTPAGSVDPVEVLDELRPTLERIADADIQIVTTVDVPAAPLAISRGHLEQIILNLVLNACEAIEGHGTVSIRVRPTTGDRTDRPVTPDTAAHRYMLLEVSDDGPGIEADTLEQIFDPFFSTKRPSDSAGLGLTTVYGLVAQHGGHVDVHSAPGHGTTFSIRLPARPGASLDTASEIAAPRPDRSGDETILLVEDEPGVRKLTVRTLERYGYTVLEADDGKNALDQLERHRDVDLVLTDVIMPNMDGDELASEVRRRFPTTDVVLMSGFAADVALLRSGPTPAPPLLGKPYTIDGLLAAVRAVLDGEPVGGPNLESVSATAPQQATTPARRDHLAS